MNKFLRLLIAGMMTLAASVAVAADVPFLSGRVVDDAEILSAETKQTLTDKLKAHEDKTGDQIAVLTVKTLGGENIEEYATRVFESWKLGQKGKDNGVLLIVASGDRRMRIEVGYGLEGRLTDLLAGRIIRNVITPLFKTGDYNGGVTAGVDGILAVLEKGEVPGMPGEGNGNAANFNLSAPDMPIMERILIGFFIFGLIGLFTVVGIVTPGSGWFLYLFLIPFWAMFPVLVVGSTATFVILVLYLIGFPIAKMMLRNKSWYQKAAEELRTKGHASIGGFTMTSGGGSWGGWSSGGGGGFSGGGGSSGGGGASGGW